VPSRPVPAELLEAFVLTAIMLLTLNLCLAVNAVSPISPRSSMDLGLDTTQG
jgi:hypothetical protein